MHRWPENVDHPVQLNFLRSVLRRLPRNQIVFAAHEDFDLRLIDLLKIPSDVVFRSARPQAYIDLYTDQDHVVLASRLHAGMLALASGVPAVFVGHDTRTYSFCQMMGLNYVELFSDSAAQQAIEAVELLMAGDVACFARTRLAYAQLWHSLHVFLGRNALPLRSAAPATPSTASGLSRPLAAGAQ
jgi:hypothetical protein